MNPSKFLTSVLLPFHFRQNSSGRVGIGGMCGLGERQIEIGLVRLYILVNSGMAENSKNKCSDNMVRQINSFNINSLICNDIIES